MSRSQAAAFAGVRCRTIDQWVYRGLITRHRDGYDLIELAQRIAARNDGKAIGGALAAHARAHR